MIFATSRFFIKSGPVDPVFITKILPKKQENCGTSLGNQILANMKSKKLEICGVYSIWGVFDSLYFQNSDLLIFELSICMNWGRVLLKYLFIVISNC